MERISLPASLNPPSWSTATRGIGICVSTQDQADILNSLMVLDFKPGLNHVENCTLHSIYPEPLHCSGLWQVGLGFLSGFCFDFVRSGFYFFFMPSICLFFLNDFFWFVSVRMRLAAIRKKNSDFLRCISLALPGCAAFSPPFLLSELPKPRSDLPRGAALESAPHKRPFNFPATERQSG